MATIKAVYLGPSHTLDGVARGDEGEWNEAALALAEGYGHQFAPADKRQTLPEPAEIDPDAAAPVAEPQSAPQAKHEAKAKK